MGYDGVEIQASYGDLIAQLLSPLLNKRTDEMGGTLENRTYFLVQLIRKVKELAGEDFPVMVKLVCDEFVPSGLCIEDAKEIAKLIEKAGADGIVANAGNKKTKFKTIPSHESPPAPLVDLAIQLKSSIQIPVVAIGKINGPELANQIIKQGKADFVAMARALVADPDLPQKAAAGRIADIRGCVYCLEDCANKGVPGIGRCCALNPFAGLEYCLKITPAIEKKKVLVIGGGPAGIQAAIIASRRGHDVELWEQSNELGGQAKLANIAPFKDEMAEALRYLKHTINKEPVKISLNSHGDSYQIAAFNPDIVIAATGSCSSFPAIPGINSDMVVDVRDLYEKRLSLGKKIVIIGGGDIGCETADWLAGPEREIKIVEILPQVLNKMKKIPKERLLSRLIEKGVTIFTETRLISVKKNGVVLKQKDGEPFLLEADHVVMAINVQADNCLLQDLESKVKKVIAVGDAAGPGNIGSAIRSATEAALKI